MDFFVVPSMTARLLYLLVVMNHARRKIVPFIITDAPRAAWERGLPALILDDGFVIETQPDG